MKNNTEVENMQIELSYLFGLYQDEHLVTQLAIGDGVQIEEIIGNHWLRNTVSAIEAQDNGRRENSAASLRHREDFEYHPYTHRFHLLIDGINPNLEERDPQVNNARQLIMRAIILSKIVNPTPIPLHPTTILTIIYDNGDRFYIVETQVGFYSQAYTVGHRPHITLTQDHATEMASLWPAMQNLYNNLPQYQRIIRSLNFFNAAYHIHPANIAHITFHTALEAIVSTGNDRTLDGGNRAQITRRTPQLTNTITQAQATAIYNFCIDVKHTGAPSLLLSSDLDNLVPTDQTRFEAARNIETALRDIYAKALRDPNFAAELIDVAILRQKYPI